jgi:hypothetical protein
MTDVMDVQTEAMSFRDEARACLQLAKAEPNGEVRTVLMGMALGWLKFADHTKPSQVAQIEPVES